MSEINMGLLGDQVRHYAGDDGLQARQIALHLAGEHSLTNAPTKHVLERAELYAAFLLGERSDSEETTPRGLTGQEWATKAGDNG